MNAESTAAASAASNRGWTVTFAGTGINLALGVLYAWSIFKGAIEKSFGWDPARLNDPYAVCCLVFAFSMILAGRCQDRLGPRLTAFLGGLLVGVGLLVASRTTNYWAWVLGFGLLAGMGIGFGYSSATPPALKWFPPSKTGLIAGLVVSGFGLASVYIAPLTEYLLRRGDVLWAMTFYSVAFTLVVCGLSLLLVNPPAGHVPGGAAPGSATAKAAAAASSTPGEMLRSPMFYLLWVIYFIGAGAGLMVISSVSGMAKKSMGEAAFVAVAVLAVGNAAGRIVAGMLSDRIGRRMTLMVVLLFQAVLMFLTIPVAGGSGGTGAAIVVVATLIGFNYGANLSLFPSFTKDLWGLKSFGVNYGFVFTAWGVGGFCLSRLQQMLKAQSGSFTSSLVTAGLLLLVGAALTFLLKPRAAAVPPATSA
ncbi:MAG TPA: OFA family MFS transporter [Verrucomicrobiota bacterium]|nr:OFA family MFS transporter [Verrucomicrobiota bacterium]HNU51446.1 OFA family MFS transporter [Verrucomicrobiota bacterium]